MTQQEYIERLSRLVSESCGENPDEPAFQGEPYVTATGAKVVRQNQMTPLWTFYCDMVVKVLEAQAKIKQVSV